MSLSDTFSGLGAGVDLFVVVGQSNTLFGAGITSADDPEPGIWQLSSSGGFAPAFEPLNHPVVWADHNGFAVAFARLYRATFGRNVLLVPRAVGSTSFNANDWNAGDARYEAAVAGALAAMAALPGVTYAGTLWHQGEDDAGAAIGQSAYATAFDAMLSDWRSRVAGDTPFIVGELARDWVGVNADRLAIQAAIDDTPNREAMTAVASSEGGATHDGLHHTAAFNRGTFADRYFAAYQSLLNQGG